MAKCMAMPKGCKIRTEFMKLGQSCCPKPCNYFDAKGKRCTAVTTKPKPVKKAVLLKKGKCAKGTWITSLKACSAAGAALKLKDKTASNDGQKSVGYDPPFCYFESGQLKYNAGGKNTGGCTSSDQCLCYTQPKPPTTKPMKKAVLRTSNKCPNGKWIKSISACADAAKYLKLKDKTASNDNQNNVSYDPPYCYFENGQLKYNKSGKNSGKCSHTDVCLCYA